MPRFFGKDYEWDFVDGKLCLRKPWIVTAAWGAPSYEMLLRELGRIEMSEGGVWHASGESQGRIPLGKDRDCISDAQAGGDAGRSDQRVAGAERDTLARQEGHGEEGTGGQAQPVLTEKTCTSCWFDSHDGCAGPRYCGCWVCFEEEAQDARQRDGR